MSLDGLRAWIGEVERKLGVRTRVFLVLTAIAIGGAGAGIYLALDAAESESDVSGLEERIDQLGTEAGTGADPRITELEQQIEALRGQVDRLEGKGAAGGSEGGAGAEGATGSGTTGASGNAERGAGAGTASGVDQDEPAIEKAPAGIDLK